MDEGDSPGVGCITNDDVLLPRDAPEAEVSGPADKSFVGLCQRCGGGVGALLAPTGGGEEEEGEGSSLIFAVTLFMDASGSAPTLNMFYSSINHGQGAEGVITARLQKPYSTQPTLCVCVCMKITH